MQKTKRFLVLLLALITVLPTLIFTTTTVSAVTPLPIVIQNDVKWTGAANTYGSGTLRATGCGIFSLVNCVGYLTGKAMDVNEVAAWAYSIGAYNKGGADGTYRYELYPYVEARYGKKYGFTMNCNGTQGWWAGAGSSVLINHLKSGGVAIGHVPGHFIAIVGYNENSTYAYHVYDSYPTTARGTGNGDCWVSKSHLSNGGKLHLDWFCLMSPAATAPDIKSVDSANYNTNVSVSWDAISGANSYDYKAELLNGEPGAVSAASTIVSANTTGTSFTVPGQASGKYIKLTVTAKTDSGNYDSTKYVRIGNPATLPALTDYIPVKEINGGTGVSNSTIWTAYKGSAFSAVYWRAILAAPAADGTYVVKNVYENGEAKSIMPTGYDILLAIHMDYANFDVAKQIVVGDKLTLVGIYLTNNVINGNGHILVNGGKPIVPTQLTEKDKNTKIVNDCVKGYKLGTTAAQAIASFAQDAQYIKVYDKNNQQVTNSTIATGYTVNLVVDGKVVVSYKLVVAGDVDGDGEITANDYTAVKAYFKNSVTLGSEGGYAADVSLDDKVTVSDYIYIKRLVSGK